MEKKMGEFEKEKTYHDNHNRAQLDRELNEKNLR
jgi:hypothetical protein